MIYFSLFYIAAIIMDFNILRKTKNFAFYIAFMLVVLAIAIFYYTNQNGFKIAEYFINLFNMEGK